MLATLTPVRFQRLGHTGRAARRAQLRAELRAAERAHRATYPALHPHTGRLNLP